MGSEAWAGIAFISFLFAILSFIANKTLGQRDKVKQIQKEVKDFQNEFQKAAKENDTKKLDQLKEREKDINGKMMQMVMLPWKASIVVLPVVWIVISFVLPALFQGFIIVLPFDIHLHALLSWTFYANIFQPASYGTTGFFIVCAIFFGLIIEGLASKIFPPKTA